MQREASEEPAQFRPPGFLPYHSDVPYRLVYVGLGLLALAMAILGVVFTREGRPVELPEPVEAVSPRPGATVIQQAVVEVDLQVGYRATIFVDGVPVGDVTVVEATGVHSWEPHPNSSVLTEWTPGEHAIRVEWNRVSGAPDVGSFEWSFRVQ